MQEIDQDHQDWHILATSSRTDERTRVVKHGESFAVFDATGMIRQAGFGELGIYHDGTRFLSRFELVLERRRPLLLGSTVRNDGVLVVDLTNPDMPDCHGKALVRDSIHVSSTSFLWDGAWYARIAIHNYGREAVELELALVLGADYHDIFEVRGMKREKRGHMHAPICTTDTLTFGYTGLDGISRTTRIDFRPPPKHLARSRAEFVLPLAPNEGTTIEVRASFAAGTEAHPTDAVGRASEAPTDAVGRASEAPTDAVGRASVPALLDFDTAIGRTTAASHSHPRAAQIVTSNERFGAWLDRSASDVRMMVTETARGPYPYAGVPWFSTAFGRDGIITAFELLWTDPDLATGVLAYLAATQATTDEPERDAQPGKIIHEVRLGEMAALGEVPFGRYYGSIDATPLFVVLAAEHWKRTADRATLEAIWPHVTRALDWLDTYGDVDGDGFIEYARASSRGLVSQGWKDSHDSISHANGELAEGPVALCEVQGYVYAARRAAAIMGHALGFTDVAHRYELAAEQLRVQFERAFWSDRLGTYVLALDGKKRPCEVRASNAGHLLWSGIADPRRAAHVVDGLLAPSMFTGWGIRTLDATAARYNPISYHNGSIWPHDNALVAIGMARYGFKHACTRLLDGLFQASHYFDLGRMPELFCGFPRRELDGPILYPVACAPQAWAAGAVFLLLQACLGIEIDAPNRRIVIDRPQLPASLEHVSITDLRVGDTVVDLACHRRADDVSVQLVRRDGDVQVAVIK